MSEIFKSIQAPRVESEPTPGPVNPETKKIENLTGENIERLDLYEQEKGRKFAEDYFGFRDLIAGDFKLKMDVSRIDKYLKEEMKSKDYDHTVNTYRNLLSEIESMIGSRILTPQKRLQKIINYISINQRLEKARQDKFNFLSQ